MENKLDSKKLDNEQLENENKFINTDIYGRKYNKTLLIAAMMIGSFVTILNQSILSTALPEIMDYFQLSASTVQWLTTAFMLVNAIMIPLTALLIEKISTKQIYLFSIFVFGIGTVLCACGQSFEFLLFGRIIQAVGAGIIAPLISTALLMIFPPQKRGAAMGMYGLVICFAPAIGPTLAGIIIDRWSWHVLFSILIPIIVIAILFSAVFMKDVIPLKNPKIDYMSIALSTLGLGLMLYGFSSAGNKGWTNLVVIVTIVIGTVISVSFIWRQLKMEQPMIEMRVFQSSTFTMTTVIGSILNITFAGSGILLPLFLQMIMGKSAFTSGLVLLPGALLMAATSLISGRLFDRYGATKLTIPGIFLLIISSVPLVNLNTDISVITITILYAARYIGIALVIMPLQTEGMNALPNKLLAHASAVVNMTKQVAASLGSAILITVMSNITAANVPDKALAKTNETLYRSGMLDATLKGVNITFIIILALTVCAFLLSFTLKKRGDNSVLNKKSKVHEVEIY